VSAIIPERIPERIPELTRAAEEQRHAGANRISGSPRGWCPWTDGGIGRSGPRLRAACGTERAGGRRRYATYGGDDDLDPSGWQYGAAARA